MRKKFFIIAVPGVIIGIIFAAILSFIIKTTGAPDAALLQPVKSANVTVTDRQIEAAQAAIQKDSKDPRGYNQLAAAFMQKSRESGDFSLNARAEKALEHSLKLAPGSFEATKLKATLELNYHRFADALATAQKAQQMNPQDHEIYGAMVDALVELGEYERAVEAAQKMVDLKPNTASYSRVSYLRSLHGDRQGAIDAMKMAIESANPKAVETIAWSRVHLGDELFQNNQPAEAEKQYDHALFVFPDYHVALAAKARARFAAGDTEKAVELYKRAIERVPLPDTVAALGDIYAVTGRSEEAKQQYDQVEFIEKLGETGGTYSRQLAMFWADHDINLDAALAAAEKERAARKDIYAADLLAWTLYKKGRFAEAKRAMDEAMRLGTRDARLFYHAGMIASALGDDRQAAEYLKQALTINPVFDILQAQRAKEKLAAINGKV